MSLSGGDKGRKRGRPHPPVTSPLEGEVGVAKRRREGGTARLDPERAANDSLPLERGGMGRGSRSPPPPPPGPPPPSAGGGAPPPGRRHPHHKHRHPPTTTPP